MGVSDQMGNKSRRRQYRFIVMDDSSFSIIWRKQVSSIRLKVLFFLLGIFTLIFVASFLLFTPVGYRLFKIDSLATVNEEIHKERARLDVLSDSLRVYAQRVEAFRMYLNFDSIPEEYSLGDQLREELGLPSVDSILKMQMETPTLVDAVNVSLSGEFGGDEDLIDEELALQESWVNFYPPVKGRVSGHFNEKNKHFAIDLTCAADAQVHAVLSGVVVYTAFEPLTGHVLILQHRDGYISCYKHNATILCKSGDFVVAGEAVAVVGNSGELTTGAHLHFELWKDGKPLNPLHYMSF